jgi:hypothetical protein
MNMRDVQPQITDYGRFCQDLLSVLHSSDTIQDDVRFYAISQIGELERNILEGANPEVQINSFLAKLPVIQFSSIPNYE